MRAERMPEQYVRGAPSRELSDIAGDGIGKRWPPTGNDAPGADLALLDEGDEPPYAATTARRACGAPRRCSTPICS